MRSRKFVATFGLGAAMLIAGCGAARGPAASGDAPGGGPPGDPGATPMRTVVVNQESAAASYPLEGGRYRVAWRSTLADCPDGLTISIKKVDVLASLPDQAPFEYEKAPDAPAFNTLLQRVPPGLYTIEQLEASCTTWEIRADRVGN